MPIGAPSEECVPFSACARQLVRPADIQSMAPKCLTLTGIMYNRICGVQQLILPIPFELGHVDDVKMSDASLCRVRPLMSAELNYLRDHPFVKSLNLARACD
jgi:hypothetical protein